MIDRRNFLRGSSVLMAHVSFTQVVTAFFASRTAHGATEYKPTFFTPAEMSRIAILVDLILPETDSVSASQAGTHEFIDAVMHACASTKQQATFRAAMAALESEGFDATNANANARVEWLKKRANADVALPYDESFFKILKDYTLTGYFHSEIGATQALAYERVPGGYIGDIPLATGQKAWAI
jgi:CO/xanthine dehydrogenase Mo-binding subunit